MAQSIRDIVCQINTHLEKVFKGGKFYGVAELVEREGKVQPVSGETPVSFDDSYAMQMYHRVTGINITYKPGFGDQNKTIDTFQMTGIVFNNGKRTKLATDEIAMIMQSYLSALSILSVRILPASIILNTPGIFNTEYRGNVNQLMGDFSLLQFNYNVEITFKSGCFDLCPEDFSQCKNN